MASKREREALANLSRHAMWPKTDIRAGLGFSLISLVALGFLAWLIPAAQFWFAIPCLFGAVVGLVVAARSALHLRRMRRLGFELACAQKGSSFDVEVTLDPSTAARLTAIWLRLKCEQHEPPSEIHTDSTPLYGPVPQTVILFDLHETLFEGSLRLGNREMFRRRAVFSLPQSVRMHPAQYGEDPWLQYHLSVLVDFDGLTVFEHREPVNLSIRRE